MFIEPWHLGYLIFIFLASMFICTYNYKDERYKYALIVGLIKMLAVVTFVSWFAMAFISNIFILVLPMEAMCIMSIVGYASLLYSYTIKTRPIKEATTIESNNYNNTNAINRRVAIVTTIIGLLLLSVIIFLTSSGIAIYKVLEHNDSGDIKVVVPTVAYTNMPTDVPTAIQNGTLNLTKGNMTIQKQQPTQSELDRIRADEAYTAMRIIGVLP